MNNFAKLATFGIAATMIFSVRSSQAQSAAFSVKNVGGSSFLVSASLDQSSVTVSKAKANLLQVRALVSSPSPFASVNMSGPGVSSTMIPPAGTTAASIGLYWKPASLAPGNYPFTVTFYDALYNVISVQSLMINLVP